MKKIRTVVVAGGCLLSVLSVVAKEVEEDVEEPKPMIGMAAYEEVLASGNYMVGPQDEFLIYVPGMDEPVIHEVLAEGSLFIPMVGMVKIGGLRLSEAHDKMEEEFRKHVRLGRIDVELSKPRAFPVPVLGLIQIRRTQQGTAVQRVSEMVPVIGELDRAASTRNIRVFNTRTLLAAEAARVESSIRSGDWSILRNLPSKRVDLVLYETTADAKYNPFVEDGDVVVIPPQLGKIGALEAVNRPRIYEFVEGDRISVLLTLAQGPAPNHALGNAVLQRYDEDNTTMYEVEVDLAAVMRGDDAANLPLKPGDQLILRANPEFQERSTIEISGEVNIPGIHVVEKTGTPLKAMIERAGGFTAYATLQEARVTRAILAKEGIGDPEFERILTTPAGDRTEEDNQYFKMRVREKPGQLVVDFAALYKSGDESQNVRLLPGDFVHIPRRQQTVMVSGRAASPGAVIYSPDHGVYDYIEQAGGFGWRATKEVRVIKASTGEIQRAEDVARIDPGDRIWIKEKPERNYWMVFAQSMAVIGQVTTVVLLYVTLTK